MIVDTLNAALVDYGNMDVRIAKAFAWLRSTDLKSLQAGQTILVDGQRVKASVQEFTTFKPDTVDFETHRAYIDLHYIIEGSEIIQCAPECRMGAVKKPYDYANDIVFYEDPEAKYIINARIGEGDYVIVFPTDGHKPRCCDGAQAKVKKVVMKIAV